jgi:hypothetical protein
MLIGRHAWTFCDMLAVPHGLCRVLQTPGNPAFVAKLAGMVREAEMDLIFALNFDFNAEVASSIVVYQLNELGLQGAPQAMRRLALSFAVSR